MATVRVGPEILFTLELSSSLLWDCLFFNFPLFVISEKLSILDLALETVNRVLLEHMFCIIMVFEVLLTVDTDSMDCMLLVHNPFHFNTVGHDGSSTDSCGTYCLNNCLPCLQLTPGLVLFVVMSWCCPSPEDSSPLFAFSGDISVPYFNL